MTYAPFSPPGYRIKHARTPAELELEAAHTKLKAAVTDDLERSTVDTHFARCEAATEYEIAVEKYHRSSESEVEAAMKQHAIDATKDVGKTLMRRRKLVFAGKFALLMLLLVAWALFASWMFPVRVR